jgi:transposase
MICAQTRFPGVSVSQVARRYDVNANQVFNWLKDPAFASSPSNEDVARFLPVEVVEPVQPQPTPSAECGEMQIELASGHCLKINGFYDPEALAVLIRNLSS